MSTKKSTTKKAASTVKTEPIENQEAAVVSAQKKSVKLDDSVLISVKSNTFGGLLYVNPRTGDKTEWNGCGDVQTLTMGDLRAMKGTQRAFFENQWIYIVGVDESGYEEVTAEDIYKSLMVTQYYKNVLDPDNYAEIFSWEPHRIQEVVSMMSDGAKMNLVVAANTCIEDGTLDSLRKIQVLEECLGCELKKP